MRIIEEIWNGYFSQLDGFEITIYLIAFGCISGFSIAISIYHLRVKPPLSPDLPAGKKQDHYWQIHRKNQNAEQAVSESVKATRPYKNDLDEERSTKTEKNSGANFGDRQR